MKQPKNAKRSYRESVAAEWAMALLSGPTSEGSTLWNALEAAKEGLRKAVAEAAEHLSRNPLSPLVAAALARRSGKRGDAAVIVDADGSVFLEIRYVGEGSDGVLATLNDLREKARALGVDVSGMGRSKRRLKDAIAAAAAGAVQPRPKRIKTAPSVTPPVVVSPPPPSPPAGPKGNGRAGAMTFSPAGDLPDGILDEPPPDKAPLTKSGRPLAEVAKAAEESEFDLDAILKPKT